MAMLNLYKSSLPACKIHMPNGKALNFVNSEFATGIAAEIEFLEAEIAAGHPTFYKDSAQLQIDSEKVDPLEAIKKKAIEEYIALQKDGGKVADAASVTPANTGMTTTASAVANLKSNLQATK
jgi:hypothetical protein